MDHLVIIDKYLNLEENRHCCLRCSFQMRHLFVVVDMSRAMEEADLKPSRLACSVKVQYIIINLYWSETRDTIIVFYLLIVTGKLSNENHSMLLIDMILHTV